MFKYVDNIIKKKKFTEMLIFSNILYLMASYQSAYCTWTRVLYCRAKVGFACLFVVLRRAGNNWLLTLYLYTDWCGFHARFAIERLLYIIIIFIYICTYAFIMTMWYDQKSSEWLIKSCFVNCSCLSLFRVLRTYDNSLQFFFVFLFYIRPKALVKCTRVVELDLVFFIQL